MMMHRWSSQLVRSLSKPSTASKRVLSVVLPECLRTGASVGQKSSGLSQRTFSGGHHPEEYPPFDRNSAQGAFGAYAEEYDRSLQDPEGFWGEAAQSIHWFQNPTKILSQEQDPKMPHISSHQWFSDGTTNTAYNCLDVHVNAGHGDRTAVIYDSPVTGMQRHISYQELLHQVSALAGALKDELGVEPGDRVIIYMPMIPEAIVAMVRTLENSIDFESDAPWDKFASRLIFHFLLAYF